MPAPDHRRSQADSCAGKAETGKKQNKQRDHTQSIFNHRGLGTGDDFLQFLEHPDLRCVVAKLFSYQEQPVKNFLRTFENKAEHSPNRGGFTPAPPEYLGQDEGSADRDQADRAVLIQKPQQQPCRNPARAGQARIIGQQAARRAQARRTPPPHRSPLHQLSAELRRGCPGQ